MSDPRASSFCSINEARKKIDNIPEVLTVAMVEDIKSAMNAVLNAVERNVEWVDKIELN